MVEEKNLPENQYSGFHPSSQCVPLPRVSPSISPREFFERFVATRQPCIITAHLQDPEWKGHLWSDLFLAEHAGDQNVQVERKGTDGNFGKGNRRLEMPFRTFLRSSDQSLYMTTQYSDQPSRLEDFCHPPLNCLLDSFPSRPALMGNLVPKQVNLWMGSSNGSSSGLHFDYHDNLYVLLRGQKTFKLFSPKDVDHLYVNGKVHNVHSNGLITFAPDIRSDGASKDEVIKWKISKLEALIEVLREDGQDIKKEEIQLENLFDAVLSGSLQNPGFAAGDDTCSEEDVALSEDWNVIDDFDEMNKNDDFSDDVESSEESGLKPEPPSFSQISPSQLRDFTMRSKVSDSFPLLAKATSITVNLSFGEMLYMPASWFHEVQSDHKGEESSHMAMNYWFYPPSIVPGHKAEFSAPYEDSFWEENWAETDKALKIVLNPRNQKGKRAREADLVKMACKRAC